MAAAQSDATAQEAQAPAVAAPAASPQKPKRALSAYWIFSSEVREEVAKESKEKANGKVSLGEVAKAIGARWAALSEADRKPYEEKAEDDKKRFEAEMQAFNESNDPAGILRKKHEHLIPKKPRSGYFIFSQDAAKREKATETLKGEGSEANIKQMASKLGEMWKAASAEEKAPFEEQYQKERAEFLEKQKTWQATPEFAEIEKAEKEMAERRKAAEADAPAELPKGTKRGKKAEGASTPSPKKAKAEAAKPAYAARGAKRAKPAQEAAPVAEVDAEVRAEAMKLGYESLLLNLAARPEVVASGKKSQDILAALKASGGLVNPAKRALVGAAGA